MGSLHIILLRIFGRELIHFSHHWSIYSSDDLNGHFSIGLDCGIYFSLGFLCQDIRVNFLGTAETLDRVYEFYREEVDILIDL